MILLVSGSREGFSMEEFEIEISKIVKDFGRHPTEVVVGDARGVDRFARDYCRQVNMKSTVFIPDWDLHGKKAGHLRNQEMIDFVHILSKRYARRGKDSEVVVLAMRCDNSAGTSDLIKRAKRDKMNVRIVDKSTFDFE